MSTNFITIIPPEDTPQSTNIFTSNTSTNNTDILFLSLEDELAKTKRPNEIFFREMSKINQYLVSYNKEMKTTIEGIHQIKQDIQSIKASQTKAESELSTLIDTQKKLISKIINDSSFNKATQALIEKLEQEIMAKKYAIANIEDNHKKLTDETLFNAKMAQVEMLKEKKGKIELCLNNFELIKERAQMFIPSLNTEKEEVAKLKAELEDIKLQGEKDTDEQYKIKQKEEINKQLTESSIKQEELLNECEKLRIALDEKMKQAVRMNTHITEGNNLLELIDKYGSKFFIVNSKEKILTEKTTTFNTKMQEYTSVIAKINTWTNKYSPITDQLNENVSIMENFLNMEIIQREQIFDYNTEITTLKNLIENNEEKIELLDLDNKALEAEIAPCELKISKYESEKKLNATKKSLEKIPPLLELIEGLRKEKEDYQVKIRSVVECIAKIEGENMKMLSEIDNKTKLYIDIEAELRTDNMQYIKCYESVLNDLPETMKSEMIKEEKKFINEEIDALNDEFNDDGNIDVGKIKHCMSNVNAFKLPLDDKGGI